MYIFCFILIYIYLINITTPFLDWWLSIIGIHTSHKDTKIIFHSPKVQFSYLYKWIRKNQWSSSLGVVTTPSRIRRTLDIGRMAFCNWFPIVLGSFNLWGFTSAIFFLWIERTRLQNNFLRQFLIFLLCNFPLGCRTFTPLPIWQSFWLILSSLYRSNWFCELCNVIQLWCRWIHPLRFHCGCFKRCYNPSKQQGSTLASFFIRQFLNLQ